MKTYVILQVEMAISKFYLSQTAQRVNDST